ncbi:MAG: NusG domain II-containing protein [Lachnospiraceae bacterium]|nr:NusG domain II-containing protein [Lachnospiraceae bacterium]
MKKKDVLLAGSLLLAACLLFFVLRPKGDGGQIRITVDGKLYGTYALSGEEKIRIEQESGVNVIHIRDGAVWMEEADCPDGYCIRQGKMERRGQAIICLPHKLVVEVIGQEENENGEALDVVVQ